MNYLVKSAAETLSGSIECVNARGMHINIDKESLEIGLGFIVKAIAVEVLNAGGGPDDKGRDDPPPTTGNPDVYRDEERPVRRIKHPKLGEYVMLTRWGDKDPHDPWAIGFLTSIEYTERGIYYRVRDFRRQFKNCFRITKEEAMKRVRDNEGVVHFEAGTF